MSSALFNDPGAVTFTYECYASLLETLADHGYTAASFDEGITDGEVLLRHDVDLSPRKALMIGQIEANHGFSSTYFFLVTTPLYNVMDQAVRNVLAALVDLGHNVGLHFDSHQYWQTIPNEQSLQSHISEDRTIIDIAAPSATDAFSFHCPPEWALNATFKGVRHTYEPAYFSEIAYAADSGQRWRTSAVLDGSLPDRLQLLTHPGLWGPTDAPYVQRVTSEIAAHVDRTELYLTRQLLEDEFPPVDFPYRDIMPVPSARTVFPPDS